MTGQTGLNGNLRRFQIPDFTNHDHIRVLSKDSPKPPGEGHIHLGVDLGLADTRQVVLDGVFDGQNIAASVVDLLQ